MRKFYWALFIIEITIIPICCFAILNTMVSIKYETENPGDCISLISGGDLCQTILHLKLIIGVCILGILISIYQLALKKKTALYLDSSDLQSVLTQIKILALKLNNEN